VTALFQCPPQLCEQADHLAEWSPFVNGVTFAIIIAGVLVGLDTELARPTHPVEVSVAVSARGAVGVALCVFSAFPSPGPPR
jgi:uncharacterized Fe-S cluster-containing radical SAM superfamily protein